MKRISARGGEEFLAPAVILATGAGWRRLGLLEEEKYTGISVKDLTDSSVRDIRLDGIFVQIGLSPNSALFAEEVPLTLRKEVIIDEKNRTAAWS